jgi:hypothetical protein
MTTQACGSESRSFSLSNKGLLYRVVVIHLKSRVLRISDIFKSCCRFRKSRIYYVFFNRNFTRDG